MDAQHPPRTPATSRLTRAQSLAPTPVPAPIIAPEDLPQFTPIPSLRLRHDGWTAQRQLDFLLALARLGLVAPAARSVGMSARTAYRLRARDVDGSFSTAWHHAVEDGRSAALDTGIERAVTGELVPVFYRGRKVGEYVRFDNRLVIAALTAAATRGRDTAAPRQDAAALPGKGE